LVAPGVVTFSDFFDEVDAGTSHETGSVFQEFGLEESQLEHVLSEMHVFGFKTGHLGKRLIELEGRVDNEVKSKDCEHVCLSVEKLRSGVLSSAGREQLLHLGHLVSFLELGSNEEGSGSHKLQLREGH
jgi:hypothetical protein